MAQDSKHGTEAVAESLHIETITTRQRKIKAWAFNVSKSIPSDTLPPKPHLLSLPFFPNSSTKD